MTGHDMKEWSIRWLKGKLRQWRHCALAYSGFHFSFHVTRERERGWLGTKKKIRLFLIFRRSLLICTNKYLACLWWGELIRNYTWDKTAAREKNKPSLTKVNARSVSTSSKVTTPKQKQKNRMYDIDKI